MPDHWGSINEKEDKEAFSAIHDWWLMVCLKEDNLMHFNHLQKRVTFHARSTRTDEDSIAQWSGTTSTALSPFTGCNLQHGFYTRRYKDRSIPTSVKDKSFDAKMPGIKTTQKKEGKSPSQFKTSLDFWETLFVSPLSFFPSILLFLCVLLPWRFLPLLQSSFMWWVRLVVNPRFPLLLENWIVQRRPLSCVCYENLGLLAYAHFNLPIELLHCTYTAFIDRLSTTKEAELEG